VSNAAATPEQVGQLLFGSLAFIKNQVRWDKQDDMTPEYIFDVLNDRGEYVCTVAIDVRNKPDRRAGDWMQATVGNR
jgi:hypothetical protein